MVILFGKYELLERINVGGMAEVFRARDLDGDGPDIAIKRILPHLIEDRQYIDMFIDEARVLVRLKHEAIIQTYEVGETDAVPYIAMEYVDGRDARMLLRHRRRMRRPPPLAIACHVMARVCEGLHCAHELRDIHGEHVGLVHRDVSPQNVLLSYKGDVKLIDFGIVRSASNSSRTEAGVVKGKFGYMSPEQVSGRQLDRRSDVFAAGICLHELLTGRKLFAGDGSYAAIEAVRNANVKPPSRLNPEVPAELEEIVLRALAKHPRDRFQTADDMQSALEAFLVAAELQVDAEALGAFMRDEFDDEEEEPPASEAPSPDAVADPPSEVATALKPAVPVWQDEDHEVLEVTRVAEGGPLAAVPDEEPLDAWDEAVPTLADAELIELEDDEDDDPLGLPASGLPHGPSAGERSEPTQKTLTGTDSSFGAQVYSAGRSTEPASPTRRKLWLVVAGFAAIALVALVVSIVQDPDPGRASLSTLPENVTVVVDGVVLEDRTSPFLVDALAPDETHTIEVSRDGHRSWRSELQVRSGEHLSLPLVILQPLDAPAPEVPVVTPPEVAVADAEPVDKVLDELVAELDAEPPSGAAQAPPSGATQASPVEAATRPETSVNAARAEPSPPRRSATPPRGTSAPRASTDATEDAVSTAAATGDAASTAAEHGYLRLNSRPWSRVQVDGEWVGNTPIRSLKVTPGRHRIRLVNDQLGISQELRVRVKAGETVTRAVEFDH